MHIFLWLIGLWVATVVAIWRIMFVLDQSPQRRKALPDNVIPIRQASADLTPSQMLAQFPPRQVKRHGAASIGQSKRP